MTDQLATFIEALKEKKIQKKNRVVYYPEFSNATQLTNHYYRACWYLPYLEGVVDEVIVPVKGNLNPEKRPNYMAPAVSSVDHIKLEECPDYNSTLANSSCVLLWDYPSTELLAAFAKIGIRAFNVTTDDVNTVEYGNYCKLMWQLTPDDGRKSVLKDSHNRFTEKIEKLRERNYLASAIFGTGPSIDNAGKFDFSRCFTHACNTVILSEDLMAHIKPDFLSAGDVVSHFGISLYAHEYRERLFEILKNQDCMFLTTAQFGYLFTIHYPEVEKKVLPCDQRGFTPNYDLLSDWNLPCLDSVFNIHMAPTCTTMSDTVFVLGCDGKNPDEKKNEDFWEHSTQAQLHDLVDTGHKCHPTFDVHRQRSTWTRYQNSIQQTCGIGENFFQKKFFTLEPSFTVGLAERHMDMETLKRNYPFMVKE